jgi:hypothetical protein
MCRAKPIEVVCPEYLKVQLPSINWYTPFLKLLAISLGYIPKSPEERHGFHAAQGESQVSVLAGGAFGELEDETRSGRALFPEEMTPVRACELG